MPAIQLTDGASLNVSSGGATPALAQYLENALVFSFDVARSGLKAFKGDGNATVAELDENDFPVSLSADAPGSSFAVEGATFAVKGGGSAFIDLLKEDKKQDFLSSLKLGKDESADLMAFAFGGSLATGPKVAVGDFTFGLTAEEDITITNHAPVQSDDSFENAARSAISATTIPHAIEDLRALPAGHVCRVEGKGSLKFTAAVQYNVLNDVLASQPLELVAETLSLKTQAGATLQVSVEHADAHQLTIASIGGKLRISASLTATADTKESISFSIGVSGSIGGTDALSFVVQQVSGKAEDEIKKIRQEMPKDQQAELSEQIKAVLESAMQGGISACLTEALEQSKSRNHLFVYDVDLDALDGDSTAAVQRALLGDFTTLTGETGLAGISEVESISSLTLTSKHGLTIHLVGILNFADVSSFVQKCKQPGLNKETGDVVLSDTEIRIDQNSIDSDHLREVLLKSAMITMSAASSPESPDFTFKMTFFMTKARSETSDLVQCANVLRAIGSADAEKIEQVLASGSHSVADLAIYLGLNLTRASSLALFEGHSTDDYVRAGQNALETILAGDDESANRRRLCSVPIDFWNELRNKGNRQDILQQLTAAGITDQAAVVDFFGIDWWAQAMGEVATAIAKKLPLKKAQEAALKDTQGGFDIPWALLATRELAGSPTIEVKLTVPSMPAVQTLTATGV